MQHNTLPPPPAGRRSPARLRTTVLILFIAAVLVAFRMFFSDGERVSVEGPDIGDVASLHGESTNDHEDAFSPESGASLLTLAGFVNSATGTPIANARITVYQDSHSVMSVVTDEHGKFAASTPKGALTVKAEAEGFGPALVQTVAPTPDVNVTLFPGNVVSGRVLLESSLQPIANIKVAALSRADRIAAPVRDVSVKTDDSGRFTFANLSAGAWVLSVTDRRVWGELPIPIAVTSGQHRHDLTIFVRPAAEVVGRLVVGDNETPCASGKVQLIPATIIQRAEKHPNGEFVDERRELGEPASVPVFVAKTDKKGFVRFEAVPLGQYNVGPVCDEHEVVKGAGSLAVTEDSHIEHRWTFAPGLTLAVRVTDEVGQPVAKAALAMELLNTNGLSRGHVLIANRNGLTNDAGEYRFGGLRMGEYKVSARYASINGNAPSSTIVDLRGGQSSSPVTLMLPGRGSIRVHARTKEGVALSRILFFAIDSQGARYEGNYGGDGIFDIGPLARGSYRVFGYDNKNSKLPLHDGRPILISDVEPVNVDFVYSTPNATIEGLVRESSGNGISGVLVRAVSTSLDETDELYAGIQTAMHGPQELMTDEHGRFRIDGLDASAAYDVYFDQLSGLKDIKRSVAPGAFVEVMFPAPASIVGSVSDASGRPTDTFDVFFSYPETANSRSQSFSKAAGRFKVDSMYPGRVRVTVIGDDGSQSAEKDVIIGPGPTASVGNFVLQDFHGEQAAAAHDQ